MMRLGLFVVMAGRQAGGVETYELNLARALAEIEDDNEYHVFCTSPAAVAAFGWRKHNFHFHSLWPGRGWMSIPTVLPFQLRWIKPGLLHACYIPPLFTSTPLVFAAHDTSVFDFPEFYVNRHRILLQNLQRSGITRARIILCGSEMTKNMIADRFKIAADRMVVIHYGVSERFRPLPEAEWRPILRDTFQIEPPYFLYVGQLRSRHKNVVRILESFRQFLDVSREEIKLVLAGKRSWTTDSLDQTIDRLRLRQHVVLPGHVCDQDLPALYSGAELFVFPSLSEGFGLAVVEAMACGTPVITSNTTSLPEVAGGAALLVDPHSVDDIAAAMHRLHTQPGMRETLQLRGLHRARSFTWRKTAEQTLEAYRRVYPA